MIEIKDVTVTLKEMVDAVEGFNKLIVLAFPPSISLALAVNADTIQKYLDQAFKIRDKIQARYAPQTDGKPPSPPQVAKANEKIRDLFDRKQTVRLNIIDYNQMLQEEDVDNITPSTLLVLRFMFSNLDFMEGDAVIDFDMWEDDEPQEVKDGE